MFRKKDAVEIVDFKKEAKRRERKEKFQRKLNDATNWFYNNKELVVFATPVLLGGFTAGIKTCEQTCEIEEREKS